jgi:hypothetical protein
MSTTNDKNYKQLKTPSFSFQFSPSYDHFIFKVHTYLDFSYLLYLVYSIHIDYTRFIIVYI